MSNIFSTQPAAGAGLRMVAQRTWAPSSGSVVVVATGPPPGSGNDGEKTLSLRDRRLIAREKERRQRNMSSTQGGGTSMAYAERESERSAFQNAIYTDKQATTINGQTLPDQLIATRDQGKVGKQMGRRVESNCLVRFSSKAGAANTSGRNIIAEISGNGRGGHMDSSEDWGQGCVQKLDTKLNKKVEERSRREAVEYPSTYNPTIEEVCTSYHSQ